MQQMICRAERESSLQRNSAPSPCQQPYAHIISKSVYK